MDAAAELGRNPVSKHQIQPEYGDEQADAGRDCRTRLARPNPQARTRTGKYSFPCFADHEQDWQPYPVDPYSCYICVTIHDAPPQRLAISKNSAGISPKLRKPTGPRPGGMGMLLSSSGASGVKAHGGELFTILWASANSMRNDCGRGRNNPPVGVRILVPLKLGEIKMDWQTDGDICKASFASDNKRFTRYTVC